MRDSNRLLWSWVFVGVGALGAGCGGNSSGDDASTPDGKVADAAPDAMPVPTRAMTIAVTDVTVVDADAKTAGLKGGVIDIGFDDLTQHGGTRVAGTSPVNGCVVYRYVVGTDQPHPRVDAGAITIGAPATGTPGLLKTVGSCAYQGGLGYQCISNAAPAQHAVVSPAGNGLASYTFTDQDFTGENLVGSYLNVNGLTAAGNNSGTGAFPIISQAGANANTLVVVNPNVVVDGTAAAVSFGVLNGAGPIPTAPLGSNAAFLGDASTSVRIQKAADPNWGPIDTTLFARGQGYALDDASDRLDALPTSGPITFSCSGANGDCGSDMTPTDGTTLRATIVSGFTTDGDTTGLKDYEMPPATTAYVAFQCGFVQIGDTQPDVTIPAAAVTAIFADNPTRVETHVLQVAGNSGSDSQMALNQGNIVVGHGLVGHTSIPH